MPRDQSIEALNSADTMIGRLDRLIAIEEQAIDYSVPGWVPGDPLYDRPAGFMGTFTGQSTQHVRPMFEVQHWSTFHNRDQVNMRVRCEPCEVSWAGDEPCFMCYEKRPVDSFWGDVYPQAVYRSQRLGPDRHREPRVDRIDAQGRRRGEVIRVARPLPMAHFRSGGVDPHESIRLEYDEYIVGSDGYAYPRSGLVEDYDYERVVEYRPDQVSLYDLIRDGSRSRHREDVAREFSRYLWGETWGRGDFDFNSRLSFPEETLYRNERNERVHERYIQGVSSSFVITDEWLGVADEIASTPNPPPALYSFEDWNRLAIESTPPIEERAPAVVEAVSANRIHIPQEFLPERTPARPWIDTPITERRRPRST